MAGFLRLLVEALLAGVLVFFAVLGVAGIVPVPAMRFLLFLRTLLKCSVKAFLVGGGPKEGARIGSVRVESIKSVKRWFDDGEEGMSEQWKNVRKMEGAGQKEQDKFGKEGGKCDKKRRKEDVRGWWIHTPGGNHGIEDIIADLDVVVGKEMVQDELVLITGPLDNHVC
jgi:hypothetical protein